MLAAQLRIYLAIISLLAIAVSPLRADEKLKGIACRSVHLSFPGRNVTAFYNSITPRSSAPGTYFMVCGWDAGYFGLQELANGKKLAIFSVWDNAEGDNPEKVNEEQRVKLLFQHPQVRVGRFGGEGTGGQSFYDFDWQLDQEYHFLVTSQPNDQRTEYTGYLYDANEEAWMKLICFSTITGGKRASGLYSFIEDFKRDRKSTEFTRRADFGPSWFQRDDVWEPINSARFTADANPVLNIDAGSNEGGTFFLATGGVLENSNTKLNESMNLPDTKSPMPVVLEAWKP